MVLRGHRVVDIFALQSIICVSFEKLTLKQPITSVFTLLHTRKIEDMLQILFKSSTGELEREQSLDNMLTDATARLSIIDSGVHILPNTACPTGTSGVTLVSN